MSRIGKQPVPIPAGVTVSIDGGKVAVQGPKGNLTYETRPEVPWPSTATKTKSS